MPVRNGKSNRFRIESLGEARVWVWKQLTRRTGRASAESLHRAWYWDPRLLEDALTSLRDQGLIRCASGLWYIRDPHELKLPGM